MKKPVSKKKTNGHKPTKALLSGGGKKGGEPMVEFTPERTVPLTINGRTIEVHAGAKTSVPANYHALYQSAVGG